MESEMAFRTTHSIFMYGDDFSDPQAESSYSGMEDIIAATKVQYPNIELKFSTV